MMSLLRNVFFFLIGPFSKPFWLVDQWANENWEKKWFEAGRTEAMRDTLDPDWQEELFIDYYFEECQVNPALWLVENARTASFWLVDFRNFVSKFMTKIRHHINSKLTIFLVNAMARLLNWSLPNTEKRNLIYWIWEERKCMVAEDLQACFYF